MGPVHGVTRLESDDFFPAVGDNPRAYLPGSPERRRKIPLEVTVVEHLYGTCHEPVSGCGKCCHTGVVPTQGAEDFFGDQRHLLICKRVYRVHVLYGEYRLTG